VSFPQARFCLRDNVHGLSWIKESAFGRVIFGAQTDSASPAMRRRLGKIKAGR